MNLLMLVQNVPILLHVPIYHKILKLRCCEQKIIKGFCEECLFSLICFLESLVRYEGWQVMFGAIGMTSIFSYQMSAVLNVSPPNHSEISYRPLTAPLCVDSEIWHLFFA